MRYRPHKLNVNKLLKNKPHQRKQYKLHNEQMTKYDIQNLASLISSMNFSDLKLSRHVMNKHDSRFNLTLFVNAIKNNIGNLDNMIIEYNEIPISTKYGKVTDKRILIRDYADADGFNLCFVLSLTTNEVVTAYWIEKDFNHQDTLNWKRYSPSLYISI